MTITIDALVNSCNSISGDIDERRWQLAELAAVARDAHLPGWAEAMAQCPNVRRSPKTVYGWAVILDFQKALSRTYALTFSHHAAAARFMDKMTMEEIEDALSDAEAEGVTVEALRVHLSQLIKPEPVAFSLADWLSEEYERAGVALADADADADIESIQRLMAAIDAERARLIAWAAFAGPAILTPPTS